MGSQHPTPNWSDPKLLAASGLPIRFRTASRTLALSWSVFATLFLREAVGDLLKPLGRSRVGGRQYQIGLVRKHSMKLKLILIASVGFFALTLGAHAESMSSETNGVPGGTVSTPGSESKGNPIPPANRSSEIIIEQGGATVMTPEVPPPPPPPPPVPQ
jgi:hypothetical protein